MATAARKPPGGRAFVLAFLLLAVSALLAIIAFEEAMDLLISYPGFALPSPVEAGSDHPALLLEGVTHASRQEIRDVFVPDFGRSLFLLPVQERRRQLLALSWVKQASVSRLWPNRVRVRIQERVPVAFVRLRLAERGQPARYLLIDAEGKLLNARGRFPLPILLGVSPEQSEPERCKRVARMLDFLNDIGGLPESMSEINVSDEENLEATVLYKGRELTLQFGELNFKKRLKRFYDHVDTILQNQPEADVFNLHRDDRVMTRCSRPKAPARAPGGDSGE